MSTSTLKREVYDYVARGLELHSDVTADDLREVQQSGRMNEYERLRHYDKEMTHAEALYRVIGLHRHEKISQENATAIYECECGTRHD